MTTSRRGSRTRVAGRNGANWAQAAGLNGGSLHYAGGGRTQAQAALQRRCRKAASLRPGTSLVVVKGLRWYRPSICGQVTFLDRVRGMSTSGHACSNAAGDWLVMFAMQEDRNDPTGPASTDHIPWDNLHGIGPLRLYPKGPGDRSLREHELCGGFWPNESLHYCHLLEREKKRTKLRPRLTCEVSPIAIETRQNGQLERAGLEIKLSLPRGLCLC